MSAIELLVIGFIVGITVGAAATWYAAFALMRKYTRL